MLAINLAEAAHRGHRIPDAMTAYRNLLANGSLASNSKLELTVLNNLANLLLESGKLGCEVAIEACDSEWRSLGAIDTIMHPL